MINFRRSAFILVVLLITILLPIQGILAVTPKVYDKAGLFSSDELERLEKRAVELSELLKLDIVIVTTDDNEGKSSRAYADDFYDYNGFGFGDDGDGLLLLINMEDREVYISTCGIAIKYFTDERINSILDKIYTKLSDGRYGDAAVAFLEEVKYYVDMGIPSNQYTVEENNNTSSGIQGNTGGVYPAQVKEEDPVNRIPVFILISLAVGGISVGVMAMNNKGTSSVNQSTYLDNNSFQVTNRQDIHVNTSVTHVTINTSSNNHGGSGSSTVHRSSSGRSHGGGGRKF